jgi:DNA processing protein
MFAQPVTREEELHWLALLLAPGLGARTAGKLLERFRGPFGVFQASRSELEAAGVPGTIAQSLASGCTFEDAALQQERMQASGTVAIPLSDQRYPGRLRQIFDPPVLLFARGRLELLDSLAIAIVGTRRPTPYGSAVSERLARDLAAAGLTIVSGMARGIDTAAHQGALTAAGATVAVLGCGADVVYPRDNARLAERIGAEGLIVSEFPMGTPAYPQNFPIRNRIVSGLSLGVLVVEGAQYSGSSITAKLAVEQGREVFAVPGNVTSRMSWGPNLLIKQGAKLVQDAQDILEEMTAADRRSLAGSGHPAASGSTPAADSRQGRLDLLGPNAPIASHVLGMLAVDTATHIDELLEKVERCSSTELIAALFEMEMLGLVKQLPGKYYLKVWQS